MDYQEYPKHMVYGGHDPDGQFNPVSVASAEDEAVYAGRGYVVPGKPDPSAYDAEEAVIEAAEEAAPVIEEPAP